MCKTFYSRALIILLTLCYLISLPTYSKEKILIYIRDDVYEDYQKFIDGRDVSEVEDFSGKTIRRDVVDMILAQQALKLGGFDYQFEYAPGKVNFRNTKLLEMGKLLISFDSYWLKDAIKLQESIYISEPVIRNGEYIAGMYTSPKNAKALNVKTLQDLSELTAVSTPKWETDWQTLQALPLKELIRDDEWLSMARMVNIQWVDFILMPFHSTADRVFHLDNMSLMPIPKVAIKLNDSRHFVISKKHPNGKEAFIAINKGLALLRAEGKIISAYTQARFFIDEKEIEILNK